MLVSPFNKLSKASKKKLTSILLVSLVLIIVVLRNFDPPIKNPVFTSGIESFELAKDLSQSKAILASWDALTKTSAEISMGLIFLF